MPANGQAVTIQELDTPFATLRLDNMDAPAPKVEVGESHRTTQVWLPGVQEATTHKMGPQYAGITLQGRFHDDALRLLGQSPEDLVGVARGILRRGNRCRLRWGTTIVREGTMKDFKATFVKHDDIVYSIVFEVDRAIEPGVNLFRAPPRVAVAQSVRNALDTAFAAVAAAKTATEIAVRDVRAALQRADTAVASLPDSLAAVEQIEATLVVLEDLVDVSVIDLSSAPTLLAKVREVESEVADYVVDLTTTDALELAAIVDAANSLALWRWRAAARQSTVRTLRQLRELQSILATFARGVEERLVTVRQGETLQSIAARELGDWREWRRLVERNPGLSPVFIAPGALIVVPTVS